MNRFSGEKGDIKKADIDFIDTSPSQSYFLLAFYTIKVLILNDGQFSSCCWQRE
jgi:hypothetical protein